MMLNSIKAILLSVTCMLCSCWLDLSFDKKDAAQDGADVAGDDSGDVAMDRDLPDVSDDGPAEDRIDGDPHGDDPQTEDIGAEDEEVDSTHVDWLDGWAKRVRLSVDHSDIDADLSDFPLLVYLSGASGRDDDDVSFVFDELTDDADRMKIAVTTADGVRQCDVEIESWSSDDREAWLWVKTPELSSSSVTDLYLYYDGGRPDNTGYVGDPDTAPAEDVWDGDYLIVLHMHEKTGDHVDSTSQDNTGMTSADLDMGISALIDGGDFFDGAGEQENTVAWSSGAFSPDFEDSFVIEYWMRASEGFSCIMSKGSGDQGFQHSMHNDGDISLWMRANGNPDTIARRVNAHIKDDEWHHVSVSYDGSRDVAGLTIRVDGLVPTTHSETNDVTSTVSMQTDYDFYIGRNGGVVPLWHTGFIDEVRVSSTVRSEAWIKATYESGKDDLIYFGPEEYH